MTRSRSFSFTLMVIAAAVSTGCRRIPGIQSVLDPVAPQATRIEHMFWLTFWIGIVVFVLVIAALARSAARNTIPQPVPAAPFHDEAADRSATRVIVVLIALTIIVLFAVLVFSIHTGKVAAGLQSNNPVSIQVVGHQWWWEVRYPSSQADQTVLTANEIHVPVGVPIAMTVTSRDVIHSFWAPNITGKRDLIPGYTTSFWFQMEKEGTVRGQCAEFCGLQHAHMSFFIVAESPERFQQWKQEQLKAASDPKDAQTMRGQQVFLSSTCVMCHTIRGTIAGSKIGPDLTHIASRQSIAAGVLPMGPGSLAGWISDPQGIKPGNLMPPNNMSSDDLQAIVAYLQTLK